MKKNGYVNKSILFLLALIFTGLAFSRDKFKVKKVNEIIITTKDSLMLFHVKQKNMEVKVKDDVIYYWYENNTIHSNRNGYSGKLLVGEYKVKDEKGNLIVLGAFKKGCKNGVWKYWDETGKLNKKESWNKGVLCGKTYQYDNSGRIIQESSYKRGVKHGKEKIYNTSVLVNIYKNGELQVLKVKEKKERVKKEKNINEMDVNIKNADKPINNDKKKKKSEFISKSEKITKFNKKSQNKKGKLVAKEKDVMLKKQKDVKKTK